MAAASAFENRLRKKWRTLRPWVERQGLTAWRLYDRDMPEALLDIDVYGDHLHVTEYPSRKARREGTETLRAEAVRALREVTGVTPEHIHWKVRVPQAPGGEALAHLGPTVELQAREGGLSFWVNLTDFWDTGLFLDHRLTRARVRGEVAGARFLNLFAYTGSFTVYAAAGGARETTTVDLSRTYLAWAERNLAANALTGPAHRFVRADVLAWLEDARDRGLRYERIVLDPPSFSRSKAMRRPLELQRDHAALVFAASALLAPGGVLYFSTNLAGFRPAFGDGVRAEELTPGSLPRDFERRDAHRCWRVSVSR